MTKIHGASVSWGIGASIYNVNGLFQQRDHRYLANKEEICDGGDTVASLVYWNFREEALFTYVAWNNFAPLGGEAYVNVPKLGTGIRVSDLLYPADSTDGALQYATTNNAVNAYRGLWYVDDILVSNSNTSAVRVTLRLSRYPLVTP